MRSSRRKAIAFGRCLTWEPLQPSEREGRSHPAVVQSMLPRGPHCCARGRSRTDTLLRAADFESAASTNSATRALRGARHRSDSVTRSQRCNFSPPCGILTTQVTRLAEIRVAEDVLAGARAGQPGAQAQLYALVAPGAFALIRRIVG